MSVFERKTLFGLTWPLFVFGFLSMLSVVAETMLLSMHSPELAAAVSIGNQILGVSYDLSGLLGIGGLVLIAQFLGANDTSRAREVAWVAIGTNTLFNVAIAAVLWIGGPWFVTWAQTPPDIAHDTLVFVRVTAVSLAFNGFLMVAASVLRGFGHTVEILVLGILSNVLYLFFEYALIFGKLGFPELGATGAALASVIVRGIGVVLVLAVLHKQLGFSRRQIPGLASCWRLTKRLFRLSFPSVGDNVAYDIYQLTMVSFIAVLGVSAVVTRSYVLTVTSFLSLIVFTISQGNETLVGYDKGGNDTAAAHRRTLRTVWGTGSVTLFLATVAYCFAEPLLGLFTKDPVVVSDGKTLLLITIFMQPFQAGAVIFLSALRAVGDVMAPVAWSLGVTWLVSLPFGYLYVTQLGWGVTGLWLAMALGEFLKCFILGIRWHRRRWVKYTPTATV